MIGHAFRGHKLALALTFGMFALWGLGHRLYDTLVPEFARAFDLGSIELVITQNLYGVIYFLFAIPAALYSRIFGSKAGAIFGLGCWCVGAFLFYPAAQNHDYLFFLFAAGVLSCGYIFLEIAVNPVIARMGPPETAVQRLNIAHALYPVGVLGGLYIGRWVILSNLTLPLERLAEAIVSPYMVIGVVILLLAFVVDIVPFPALATERVPHRGAGREMRLVLAKPLFVAALAAQACSVAARAGTWALSASYIKDAVPGASITFAADFLLACLVLYGIGRVAGAILMTWVDAELMLAIAAGAGTVLALIACLAPGMTGLYALAASSFTVSIMYPTILGLAIRDLGPLTKMGTALIYMGASGAAIGVALMHLVWTVSSTAFAMLVPMVGYAAVLAFALMSRKSSSEAAAQIAPHATQ